MHAKWVKILVGIGIVLFVLIAGYAAIRPLHLGWGATQAELAKVMPGDLNGARWTRAILVNATPEQIWPWLMQLGQGRGGWYSYDWLENLLGFDIHTAEQVLPEYQNTAIGDKLCLSPTFCPMNTTTVEPYRWLVWQAKDEATGKPVWSFVFGLSPVDGSHTRLVVRESFDKDWLPPAAAIGMEIPDVVMEQKALTTLKHRAEGTVESGLITPTEIAAWLAALVMGLTAAVLFVRRADWQKPLAVGAAAVLILLLLTFLFPPLWLRGALDLGLLAGLVWSYRRPALSDNL